MYLGYRQIGLFTCLCLFTAVAVGQAQLRPVGGDATPPQPPPGLTPSPGPIGIRGNERLVWDQRAESTEVLTRLGFAAYVDANRVELASVNCATSAGPGGFECHARLPPLPPGLHTIVVRAFARETGLEGPPSNQLVVRAEETSALGAPASGAPWSVQHQLVVTGLHDITDVAVLPDGRVLIAERAGQVLMQRDGIIAQVPGGRLDDLVTGQGRGLLSLALDGHFASTGAVFMAYTTNDGLRVARFVLSANQLVSRAVIVEGLPVATAHPTASMRIGPDGMMHLALDDAGSPERSGDAGSLVGKLVRIGTDGSAPADQRPGPPILASGLHRPGGLAWATPSSIWLVDWDPAREGVVTEVLRSSADGESSRVSTYALPAGLQPSAIAVHRGDPPISSEVGVFIGNSSGMPLLRLALDRDGTIGAAEWWPIGDSSPIRALVAMPDGALLIATSSTIYRIDPMRRLGSQ